MGHFPESTQLRVQSLFLAAVLFTSAAWISAPVHAGMLAAQALLDANVRNAPAGKVIATIKARTHVAVIGYKDGWSQVVYLEGDKGRTGWISARLLGPVNGEAQSSPRSMPPPTALTGDDCDSEFKTNAEVCVSVSDSRIDCRKSLAGDYYSGCVVEVEYDVETDYRGRSYLDAEVECEVEMSYRGPQALSTRTDSQSDSETYNLYAMGSESDSMTFAFSFGVFDEITRARIESTRCEVRDINLW